MKENDLRIMVAILFLFICSCVHAQSKIHFHVDYHYLMGVVQKNGKYSTIHRSDEKMGGSSFRLSGMYSLNKRTEVGIGVGADCYNSPNITTFPVLASLKYVPLKHMLDYYIYTDAGYAFGTKISDKGAVAGVGLGYKRMFKKHFGLKLELGYNIQQIRVSQENIIVFPGPDGVTPIIKGLSVFRHSISFGTGFIF